jgi:hypothetical protein
LPTADADEKQLPDTFPHTRRGQYLVSLPEELLTVEELPYGIAVLRRLRRFDDRLTLRCVTRLQEAGWSDERIADLMTAGTAAELRAQRWRCGPLARR